MAKSPGLYHCIGKKARDLLKNDYQRDQKFSFTTRSSSRVAITASGTNKAGLFSGDVHTRFKTENVTTDFTVDTNSNLSATVVVDEAAPGLKTILGFKVPDRRSGKLELQYLHDYMSICTSVGLTANPKVNFSGVIGTDFLALGSDVSFDTKTRNFTKCNAAMSFANADLIAALTLDNKGDVLKGSFYHLVHPVTKLAVGAEMSHTFSTNNNTVIIGAQRIIDSRTIMKARIDNLGKTSAVIQHEWRPKSFVTVCAEVDTRAIEKSAKFGLTVALMYGTKRQRRRQRS
ncbi:hypothetical protein RND81_03G086900 [Saponaria officinalis]|uniref:Uncharacterized protein n=1 Tax=Saponaria officinalis TaxID=3572 RepID=A0AAW1M5B6_SAPOF